MNERGVFWPQMVQKYNEVGIKSVMSYPISDRNETEYIEGLFDCAQHLNDLIEEQDHVVYLHCNSSISRSPTLV
jgi:protein-tyrosine phosphatase